MTRMRTLIFSMGLSADGYIAGPDGRFDWAAPDEELHRFHNAQTREIDVHLCGRGLYETMVPWERDGWTSETELEFAQVWRGVEKVVFSHTLERVEGHARLATRGLAEEVAALKAQPGKDIAVGGADLAGQCTALGLIDEYRLFVNPVIAGGGTPFFPPLPTRVDLELLETRTFGPRVVYLRYRVVR